MGGSRRTQDLSLKSLNSFTIQSRVKKKQESTSVFKGEFPQEKIGPFDPMIGGIYGHDHTMIVGHECRKIMVLIVHQMSHDRATIGPRSCIDRGS